MSNVHKRSKTAAKTPADPVAMTAQELAVAAAAVASDDNPLKVPYTVALKEAVSAAAFVAKYWDADGNRPALSRVSARLPRSTSSRILTLVGLVQAAQTELLLIVDPVLEQQGARGLEIADALESAIAYTLDDDVHEDADDQLAQMQTFHAGDDDSSSALAQRLLDYAALAERLGDRIVEADAGFDPTLIAQARTIAAALEKAVVDAASAGTPAAKAARSKRNRLLTLLVQNVALVRKAAAHVFREFPDIVRESTSAYDRRRRQAARSARAAKSAQGTNATAPAAGVATKS